MAKYKVMMSDTVFYDTDIEESVIRQIDADFVLAKDVSEDALIEAGHDCDGIINVYAPITRRVLENCPRVKIVARSGVGVDTIDVAAASELGVRVSNVPDYCLDEVADHTLALFLDLRRKITFFNNRMKNKLSDAWDVNKGKPMHRLRGGVFGLVGFGNIARLVAERARAFGMRTIAYDPFPSDDVFRDNQTERVDSIAAVAEASDAFSLHIPLLEENRGIIDRSVFRVMKPGAVILNTARGPLVNEDDLIQALKDGTIGGAGLDVLTTEPLPNDSPLLEMDQVILTPHIGFYSEEAIADNRQKMAMEVVRTLTEGQPRAFYNKNQIQNPR